MNLSYELWAVRKSMSSMNPMAMVSFMSSTFGSREQFYSIYRVTESGEP